MSKTAEDRIIYALRAAPGLSREEIATRAFVGENTLSGGGYLKAMKLAGLIHISGWRRNASGAFTTPLYSAGAEDDCKRPRICEENRQAPGMERLLEAIMNHGPIDYRQAAKLAALSPNTVKNAGYLEALLSQKKIHIADWRRGQHGPMRAMFDYGPGKSAPRPTPNSNAEKLKSLRLKKKILSGNLAAQVKILSLNS